MIQRETHLQQQAALEDSRRHLPRIADGAEQDGVVLPEAVEVGVGEQLTIALVAAGAEIVFGGLEVADGRAEDLEGLGGDLGADAVAVDDGDLQRAGGAGGVAQCRGDPFSLYGRGNPTK